MHTTQAGSNQLRLKLSKTQEDFWQCLAHRTPQWVVLTTCYLSQELPVVTRIREQYASTRIILCVLPDSPTPATLWPLMKQIEAEVLCTLAELPDCLTEVFIEGHYNSSLLVTYALIAASPHPPALVAIPTAWQPLTCAERRVMRELLHDHSRQKVASILFISPRTVDNHKASIARKLFVSGTPYSLTKYILLHKGLLASWLDLRQLGDV